MPGDTGMAGKVALLLWASPCPALTQGDQGVPVLKTSVLHQCSLGESLGTDSTPHPPGASVPAGQPHPAPVPAPFQPRSSVSQVSPQGMPCPHPAVPSPVAALAGWCPLSLTDTQTTQLLVEPPWIPAVLWDRVTLTCQGSGTAGATTWYKDGQRWGQDRHDRFTVTVSGTYKCQRRGSGLSPPVAVLNDQLVLQVPALTLLEGDTVTLRCRAMHDMSVSRVRFYQDGKDRGWALRGAKLFLSPLELHHSGHYHCEVSVGLWPSLSPPVTVRVHELFTVPVLEGPPELTEGSPLNLSCLSTPSPLRPQVPIQHLFYRDGQLVGGPQVFPQILMPAVKLSHSGYYSCQVHSEGGIVQKSSAWLRVTVHMPVANATITPGPLSHQVHAGDPVTLHCSVQVGSAPVTFTWLHNGREVAQGPILELGDVDVGHSGTYQCVATNQLGQDRHRVFRALSPELALEVTLQGPKGTVAAGVGGSLFLLVLLVAVIVTWHRWHRLATRKHQKRAPPEPPAPPEEGEVLYTHVVNTKQAQRSPHVTVPQEPQVTYAELPGPHGKPQEPSDIFETVP
ncbi:LOW QUALITY PROTEIN: Fc receptor-like protein 4 [Chamaea fasciata]|uniref:LOW QUALITY PROTEIN: Fc receptor-like protein 4 n=1 Tax=Chamaea fasciata TaxID=190680 RepID=UPI00336AB3AF